MKSILFLTFISLFISCNNDDDADSNSNGTVPDVASLNINTGATLLNNQVVSFDAFAELETAENGFFNLTFRRNPEGPSDETWSLSRVAPIFDIQQVFRRNIQEPIDSVQSVFLTSWSGDLLNHEYIVDLTLINRVQLISFNNETRELQGVFKLHYIIEVEGPSGPEPPERIDLEQGVFKVFIDSPELFE